MLNPADHIAEVARRLLGEPNPRLSTKMQLRYGTNGSLSIDIAGEAKGTWFDHEAKVGGGVLDLIHREKGFANGEALEWLKAELRLDAEPRRERRILATYDYKDEHGALRYQVVRFEPKDFRQRRPKPGGDWDWSIKGLEPLPYRLPDLLAAPNAPVFIAEGEKDVDALSARGLVATCNNGGAGKWPSALNRWLKGRAVNILPDNDEAGAQHAALVARELCGVAASVRICPLPDLPPKGDVSDWLAAGGDAEQLIEHCRRVAEQQLEADPPLRFKLVALDDVRMPDGDRYLVKGLLPRTGLVLVWGPPKCGKSFWAFDLLMHVALGWPYRGMKVLQGAVVYIPLEGAEGFKLRIEAFRQVRMTEGASGAPFYLAPARLDLIADHEQLIADIRAQLGNVKPVAVALDTLNRSLSGSESSDEDMSAYVRAADAIRDAFDCAVVVIHHCGHDAARPRGHTSLTGAVDAQLAVKRDDDGRITTTVEWLKDGQEGATIGSTLEVVELGQDEDGDPITSCVIAEAEASASTTRAKVTGASAVALRLLRQAIEEAGEAAPPSVRLPDKVRGVTVSLWRAYCARGQISEGETADAARKAFKRSADRLQAAGLVGVFQDFVWLT